MKPTIAIATLAALCAVAACSPPAGEAAATVSEAEKPDAAATLDAVLAGAFRPDAERARDGARHPKETLLFFGAEPSMTIVEVSPGGGWYTNIIAPFLAKGEGTYYAANIDPNASPRAAESVAAFAAKYQGDPATYGTVVLTVLADAEIAPPESADMVLTFRNVHNWMGGGAAPANFAKFYAALKPGGVLGVVEHRADETATAETEGSSGYVKESTVIAFAEAAGFELEARSDINANPADTKDHPFGVWTLPPVRRSSAVAGTTDPDFDRAKYDAIGESDRMTLKFRKPVGADGALLQ